MNREMALQSNIWSTPSTVLKTVSDYAMSVSWQGMEINLGARVI
jgi:hypothetical protein